MEKKKSLMMIPAQIVVIFAFVALALGCGSSQEAADFSEGFRKGWNSTAPSEYRY